MSLPSHSFMHQGALQPLDRAHYQMELMQEKLQKKKESKLLDLAREVGKVLGVYSSKKLVLEDANKKLEKEIEGLKKKHVEELNSLVIAYEKKNDLVQGCLARIIEMIVLYTQRLKGPCGALQIDSYPFNDFKNAIPKVDYSALRKYSEYPETFANKVTPQEANSTQAVSCLSPLLIYQASRNAPKTLQFGQNSSQDLSLEASARGESSNFEIEEALSKSNMGTATEEFIEESEAEFQELLKEVGSLEQINKKLLQKQEEMTSFHHAFLEEFNKERQKEIDPKQIISKIRSLIGAINWGFNPASCPNCPYFAHRLLSYDGRAARYHQYLAAYNAAELTRLKNDVIITVEALENQIDPVVIKNE